jgi:hypothetical protein
MLCFVLRSLNTLQSGRNNSIVEGVRGKRSKGEGRDADNIREVMHIRSLEKGLDEDGDGERVKEKGEKKDKARKAATGF